MSRLIVRYLIAKFPKGSGDIFRFIDESQFLFGKFKLIHLFYSRHSWEYLRQKTSVAKKTRIFSCSFCFITSQNQNLFSLLNIFSSSSFLLGYYVFNSFFARLFLKMLYGHIEYATTPRADEQVSFTRLVTLLSDWHLAVGSNKWFSIKFYDTWWFFVSQKNSRLAIESSSGSLSQISYRLKSITYRLKSITYPISY